MITKKQLQAMSDFEVNKALAESLGMTVKDYALQVCLCGYDGLDSTWDERDYCSTPNDIMPLAFEHNISIISCDGGNTWWAKYATEINHQFIMCSKQSYRDANALRAIACCLIIVLQEQKQ